MLVRGNFHMAIPRVNSLAIGWDQYIELSTWLSLHVTPDLGNTQQRDSWKVYLQCPVIFTAAKAVSSWLEFIQSSMAEVPQGLGDSATSACKRRPCLQQAASLVLQQRQQMGEQRFSAASSDLSSRAGCEHICTLSRLPITLQHVDSKERGTTHVLWGSLMLTSTS